MQIPDAEHDGVGLEAQVEVSPGTGRIHAASGVTCCVVSVNTIR